jgi:septum formation protein
MEPLVLASASPRRRQLLETVGLPVVVDPVEGAEPKPEPGEPPLDYVVRATRAKASAARARAVARADARVIVAADTIVIAAGQTLGKPDDRDHARRMLSLLAGREHIVATAFFVGRPGPGEIALTDVQRVVTSIVMRPLRPRELEGYLDSQEWADKAGAYAVQGLASFFVERISGSYPNVVGLPVCEVVEALWRIGALAEFPAGPAT